MPLPHEQAIKAPISATPPEKDEASKGSSVPAFPPAAAPPSERAKSVGHWIHTHKNLPQSGWAGFTAYQVVRSAIASVPYGISMALTLAGLVKAEQFGKTMAEDKSAGAFKKSFGTRLNQFATSPAVKVSALVATSFTLYRGTSKVVKWVTEYLFNPKDSEETTIAKVQDLPHETWRKIKEVAPAEVSSTPVPG